MSRFPLGMLLLIAASMLALCNAQLGGVKACNSKPWSFCKSMPGTTFFSVDPIITLTNVTANFTEYTLIVKRGQGPCGQVPPGGLCSKPLHAVMFALKPECKNAAKVAVIDGIARFAHVDNCVSKFSTLALPGTQDYRDVDIVVQLQLPPNGTCSKIENVCAPPKKQGMTCQVALSDKSYKNCPMYFAKYEGDD